MVTGCTGLDPANPWRSTPKYAAKRYGAGFCRNQESASVTQRGFPFRFAASVFRVTDAETVKFQRLMDIYCANGERDRDLCSIGGLCRQTVLAESTSKG